MRTHWGEDKVEQKHNNYYPAPNLCSFSFNILFVQAACSRCAPPPKKKEKKKGYKEFTVDSSSTTNKL